VSKCSRPASAFFHYRRDAVADEEEEEITGNVKGDQASVADSNASANKLVRCCTKLCLPCLQTADMNKLRERKFTFCVWLFVADLVVFQHVQF